MLKDDFTDYVRLYTLKYYPFLKKVQEPDIFNSYACIVRNVNKLALRYYMDLVQDDENILKVFRTGIFSWVWEPPSMLFLFNSFSKKKDKKCWTKLVSQQTTTEQYLGVR